MVKLVSLFFLNKFFFSENFFLGNGKTENVNTPVTVSDKKFTSEKVKMISLGANHTLALTDTNSIYSWGKVFYLISFFLNFSK